MSSNVSPDETHTYFPPSHSLPLSQSSRSLQEIAYLANQQNSRHLMNHSPSFVEPYSRYRDQLEEKGRWSDYNDDGGWTSGEETVSGEYMNKEYDEPPSSKSRANYYPSRRARRPLIDLVRNEWRTNPQYAHIHYPSSDQDLFSSPHWTQIVTARKVRRYALIYILLCCIGWFSWSYWLEPMYEEHTLLRASLDERMKTGKGWFGANMRPKFKDVIQLETLDASLIPQGGKGGKRLIIVGDVHGCKDELADLLSEVSYNSRTDHLILTGDMISKGPSSPAVVSMALSLNASCVRGNHEDRVLLAHRDMNTQHLSLPGPHESLDPSIPDNLDEESFSQGDYADRKLAKSLSEKQIAYLAACPLILKLGDINGMGRVSVVHAGLVPGIELERQDPSAVMNMRTVDLDTHVPSRDSDGIPWSKLWNKYQTLLPHSLRQVVIYGHDAHRGLSFSKYAKGLDSGCVKGGRLTALVIESGGRWSRGKVRTRIVSVGCKDYIQRSAGVGLGMA